MGNISRRTLRRQNGQAAGELLHHLLRRHAGDFDANGDMKSKVVSIFQVQYDQKVPIGDVVHQFKYVGVAPEA
jgi:hypothetical protein